MVVFGWVTVALGGVLEENVPCAADPDTTYALYLPDGWDPAERWPLLLVMDPRGRAVPGADRFFEAADRYGWVVASSYDTRSDLVGVDPNGPAIAAMLADVGPRASIAEDEIALAGFSGTARMAWAIGLTAPELVFAVLSVGAGSPESVPPTASLPFAWFGVAGNRDYNYRETRAADLALAEIAASQRGGSPHRFGTFDGPHSWPPPEVAGRMLGWAEVEGQKAGRRPADPARIDRALEAERAWLATLTTPWEQQQGAEAVARTFAGLRDVAAEQALAEGLAETREVRARRRLEANLADQEEMYEARLGEITHWILAPTRAPPTPSEAAFRLEVSALLRTAERTGDPRGDSAARILASYGGTLGFYVPRDVGVPRKAAASLAIAALVRPESADTHYNLGCAWALAGGEAEALDALERAVELGYTDGEWMAADEDLASLRSEPRFVALVARLRAQQGADRG